MWRGDHDVTRVLTWLTFLPPGLLSREAVKVSSYREMLNPSRIRIRSHSIS